MPGASAQIELDDRRFLAALDEAERDLKKADYQVVTENARNYLRVVTHRLPMRTGNYRSAAITPWRVLGMQGRPPTPLDEGEKSAAYQRGGRIKVARLFSRGSYEDQRTAPEKPYFTYYLFAAEWRGRRDGGTGKLPDLLKSSLLTPKDAQRIGAMLANGTNYATVWNYVVALLSGIPAGRTWLINNGGDGWRPYSLYLKGHRKKITETTKPPWKWGNSHARVLKEKSGK